MIAFPMHYARLGALALLLALPGCTIAIGAPPEGAPGAQGRRERPRDQIVIRANPRADEAEVTMEPGEPAPGASLLIPVRGVRPDQLRDSYADARSGGRVHNAIDIMAPGGTPVLAAADGTIHRLRTGGMGGVTIYQIGEDGRTLYYYAHLQRYAAGMRDGLPVRRGQVIAYVGDTGNAGQGNYHLHFSVGRLPDPQRYWDSENVNPYPLLAGEYARRTALTRDR
ncbi:MAG TPA: M23 family metallopeptidase [Longimicrobium sp.]|jgi:murein DD-endopeptidase MepM/ murein hydrolase activator NlpD|uniref:M23 family metallopeptidase n=1 Tax=Longimicrobium sp. TaxID=2029185 RepID=UPI002ED87F34